MIFDIVLYCKWGNDIMLYFLFMKKNKLKLFSVKNVKVIELSWCHNEEKIIKNKILEKKN